MLCQVDAILIATLLTQIGTDFDWLLSLIGHRNGRVSPIGGNSNADRSERREEDETKKRCRSSLFSAKGKVLIIEANGKVFN